MGTGFPYVPCNKALNRYRDAVVWEEDMESDLLGETPVCSPAEPLHWQFLTLLDAVGRHDGQALVMEMADVHAAAPLVQMDFAQELFRGIDLTAKLHRKEAIKDEEQEMQPQLVFMLWQAATLRQLTRLEHLDETLWNLRNLFSCMPAVLVLVMIQPDLQHQLVEPERAAEALRRMQCLLDGGVQELVVEAAVYSPGQPDGTLEVKKAACRALREVLKGQEEITPQDPVTIRLSLGVCNTGYERRYEDRLLSAAM